MALKLSWKIKIINILPFGGLIEFDEGINKKFNEELMISISGIIMQIIFYIIVLFLYKNGIINYNLYHIYKLNHYSLLFFNLLPIFPLDGYKILNIFLSYFIPFKKAHVLSIYLSLLIILLIYLYTYYSISLYAIIFFLLYKTITEYKNRINFFNKFLLERYLGINEYKKYNIIKNMNFYKMKKYKKNIFKSNNHFISEKTILNSRFGRKLDKL